jgi:hypothetical protein
MTVDPHQVQNLVAHVAPITQGNEYTTASDSDEILQLLHKLSRLLARLGNCTGSECYELENEHFESGMDHIYTVDIKRALSLQSMQSSIRNRIPCHNPPNMATDPMNTINQRRKPFAYDLHVPEPFTNGFPFQDGDNIGADMLQTWADYQHYFH